ncbi:MAG: hypothetical protein QM775_02350 [Pirellulales bacterium]
MNVSSAATAAPVPRRSLWRRLILLTLAAVVLVTAFAPAILSWSPTLRNALLRRLTGDIHGTLTVADLRLGWLQPIIVTGVRLDPIAGGTGPATTAGEPLLTIDRLESDQSLWHILTNRTDIGSVRIERPTVFVKFTEKTSNYGEVFAPVLKLKPPPTLNVGVNVRVVDGRLHGISTQTQEPWEITGINIGVGVRPEGKTKSGKAELIVEKGTLVARQPLTVGMCNDVLKYAAPVLADAARTAGLISIELDDWRLPWNDFGNGELSGRLTMHSVVIGPGPIVQMIIHSIETTPLFGDLYRGLGLPAAVEIAHESTVPFKMIAGGRIHHENLRFSVADLVDVQSHGTVGLDETLDLQAALGIHPPRADERRLALLRVLNSQPWPVNIRGNLGKPEIDLSPLNNAWKQLVFQKLPQDWQSGRGSIGEQLLRGLSQNTGLPVDPETVGPLLQMLGPLIDGAQSPTNPQTPTVPQGSRPQLPTPQGPMPRELEPGTIPREPVGPQQPAPPVAAPSATAPTTAETIADGVGTALDVLDALVRVAKPPCKAANPRRRCRACRRKHNRRFSNPRGVRYSTACVIYSSLRRRNRRLRARRPPILRHLRLPLPSQRRRRSLILRPTKRSPAAVYSEARDFRRFPPERDVPPRVAYAMANAFDPYREALVVETNTVWPAEYSNLSLGEKAELEVKLHAAPKDAADLDYTRLHTGFCRDITVTEADLARVRK